MAKSKVSPIASARSRNLFNGPITGDSTVDLVNERSRSSGNTWRYTILEASGSGEDISLDYANPISYEHPNNNTTVAKYKLKSGVYIGQPGDRSTNYHNLDLSKAKSVSGKTYDIKDDLKEAGFRWDRGSRKWVK